jgi:hypothetical protein
LDETTAQVSSIPEEGVNALLGAIELTSPSPERGSLNQSATIALGAEDNRYVPVS